MALNRSNKYPGRFSAPTVTRPQGAFKNRTSPTAQDGSYLEQDWANDWDGFFARMLTVAGITPNGNVDSGSSSQYFDAMVAAIKANLGTAAQRNVGTAANQIPDISNFTSGTSGTAGWMRFPNAFLVQYGYIVTSSTAQVNVTFPVAFSASVAGGGAAYSITATAAANISATASGSTLGSISGLRTFNTSGAQQSNGVFWMATGF